jgi:hypothetical protein
MLGLSLLVAPTNAGASTVSSVVGVDALGEHYQYAKFTATRGERNRLTVRAIRNARSWSVVIRDIGSRVRVRGRCTSLDSHSATCPTDLGFASIWLRDRPDRVTTLGRGSFSGGAGNDLMIDRARSGVALLGGEGNDVLRSASGGSWLDGGRGDDALYGGTGNDEFSGGPGNDRLSGGAGADALAGDAGRDRLAGGSGDDHLASNEAAVGVGAESAPTMPDELACGRGADDAASDAADTLRPSCEELVGDRIRLATAPVLRGDRAEFVATWILVTPEAAIGTISLHSLAGEQYGNAGYVVPPYGMATVSVPLSSAGVAALRAGTTVQVDLVSDGLIKSSGYRMFLRAG